MNDAFIPKKTSDIPEITPEDHDMIHVDTSTVDGIRQLIASKFTLKAIDQQLTMRVIHFNEGSNHHIAPIHGFVRLLSRQLKDQLGISGHEMSFASQLGEKMAQLSHPTNENNEKLPEHLAKEVLCHQVAKMIHDILRAEESA